MTTGVKSQGEALVAGRLPSGQRTSIEPGCQDLIAPNHVTVEIRGNISSLLDLLHVDTLSGVRP